jgi:hypothetical protein
MTRLFPSLFLAAVLLGSADARPAQEKDLIADFETDRMRDAQGLEYRIPLLLRLADKRLVALEIKQLTEKEKAAQKKEESKLDELVFKSSGRVPIPAKNGEDPDAYIKEYSKTELLRGYAALLDEAMDFIDDAFKRKLDVRPALEQLDKYAKDTRPLLDRFKPSGDAEEFALETARDNTDAALHGAAEALENGPITEKKPPKP